MFLRLWHEISIESIQFDNTVFKNHKNVSWVPMHKGGGYRKHYGLHDYVMNLHDIWDDSKTNSSVRRGDPNFYFKEGLTWSTLSNDLSVRKSPAGFVFDTKGSMCFPNENTNINYLEAFLNSSVASFYMSFLSPTLDFGQGSMEKIPIIFDEDRLPIIVQKSKENIETTKDDWDDLETSWEFRKHPLIPDEIGKSYLISDIYSDYVDVEATRIDIISKNECYIDNVFSEIFGLDEYFTTNKHKSKPTITPRSVSETIKSLLSYFVGTVFGRYSLSKDGLVFAGGEWNNDNYTAWIPDKDNIIPIGESDYFDDDLASMLIDWLRIVYGNEMLEDNIQFIADALGGKGTPREIIRKYFLNDFFTDHCKTYKKRPIYWLFDSGKKNGFKCLLYMHRYQPDTLARIRTDYVLEQQERYRSQIKHINETINEVPKSEQIKMKKNLKDLEGKLSEVTNYEEKIHHLADQMIKLDLDDGVKHNYAIFQDVLAKIK